MGADRRKYDNKIGQTSSAIMAPNQPLEENHLQYLVTASNSYQALAGYLLFALALYPVLFVPATQMVVRWTKRQDWWSRAHGPVKGLMINFGYPAEPLPPQFPNGITETDALGIFAWICVMCAHHIIAASFMAPMVCFGTQPGLFVAGALIAVSFDIYDLATMCIKCFTNLGRLYNDSLPHTATKALVVMGMHHISSTLAFLPMARHLALNPDYHLIAFSLLFAAGVNYLTGQYKFTLDISTASGLNQVKVIAVIQSTTIMVTRVYIWLTAGHRLLTLVVGMVDQAPELYAVFVGAATMSLFNLVMVMDATSQVLKWLSKKTPTLKAA